jgi:hypothetical protein
MRSFTYISAFIVTLLLACNETKNQDSKAIKEEMRQREVIHLTDAQISERAFEIGDSLIARSESILLNELKTGTHQNCIPAFTKTKELIGKEYGGTLFRMPFDNSRIAGIASKKEREIMDAYLYNRENHLVILPNYQKDGDKEFFFTKALVLNQKQCVSCHMNQSNPLLKASMGDTLGLWSVRYLKKKVVMSFVE